jgi:baculoviral IAP repeat-containing protein 6
VPGVVGAAACPACVTLELSHDGQYVVPLAPPLLTASLALIKLQLLQPAVVTVVTLRLHRPKDSSTMGLQQICLLGQRACGESEGSGSGGLPTEEAMTRMR